MVLRNRSTFTERHSGLCGLLKLAESPSEQLRIVGLSAAARAAMAPGFRFVGIVSSC